MRIDIIAIIPELLDSPFQHSILKRAEQKGLLSVHIHDLKHFGTGKHNQIDDYQYGGSSGMVIKIEPLDKCISGLKSQRNYDEIIYLTPDGELLNQKMANRLSLFDNLMVICGHYKGIDHRVREYIITKEISIGEYVLSGGELAAAVLVDSIGRLIPGVLNDGTSALTDTFQDDKIAPPIYTRPEVYKDWKVPNILLSGNDKAIMEWKEKQSKDVPNQKKKN